MERKRVQLSGRMLHLMKVSLTRKYQTWQLIVTKSKRSSLLTKSVNYTSKGFTIQSHNVMERKGVHIKRKRRGKNIFSPAPSNPVKLFACNKLARFDMKNIFLATKKGAYQRGSLAQINLCANTLAYHTDKFCHIWFSKTYMSLA